MSLVDDLRKAISQAAPCGEDARYDDDYAFIKAELSKTTDNDWGQVVKLGRAILAGKSKDLNVATWLCIGLLQTQGFAGLAEGFEGYRALIHEHWEGLFPTSPRGRKNALEMLRNRLGGDARTAGLIEARKADASDRETLQRVVETLKGLETDLQAKFPDESFDGFFYSIVSAVQEKLKDIEAEQLAPTPQAASGQPVRETKPEQAAPKVAPTAQPAASRPAPAPTQQRPEPSTQPAKAPATGGWKNRNEVIDTLTRAAASLRELEPKNPAAYRLLRMIRWDAQQQAPPNGTLVLSVDEKNYREHFSKLIESGNWEKLLEQAESLFADGCHFWLDLQRYIDIALKGLGDDYAAARRAILRETAMLINRLPRIAELSYRGNVAFANPETKDWIEKEALPSLNGPGGAARANAPAQKLTAEPATVKSEGGPAVTISNVADSGTTQRINVGGEGAHVDIQIRIYTK